MNDDPVIGFSTLACVWYHEQKPTTAPSDAWEKFAKILGFQDFKSLRNHPLSHPRYTIGTFRLTNPVMTVGGVIPFFGMIPSAMEAIGYSLPEDVIARANVLLSRGCIPDFD